MEAKSKYYTSNLRATVAVGLITRKVSVPADTQEGLYPSYALQCICYSL